MAGEGTVPLVVLMALPLDVALLRVTICFFGAMDAVKEAFEEGFWFLRERSSV